MLIVLVITLLVFNSCDNQKDFQRLEIWENIRIAAKEENINYLIEISKDTLECIECNEGKSKIAKEDFFHSNISQIEVSDTKEYTFYSEKFEEEKGFIRRHRINYAYEGLGKGEIHNSIYTILEGENSIQFQGVFGIP